MRSATATFSPAAAAAFIEVDPKARNTESLGGTIDIPNPFESAEFLTEGAHAPITIDDALRVKKLRLSMFNCQRVKISDDEFTISQKA